MKILLAVDDSDDSRAAVDEVLARPWPPGCVLRVLTAVPFSPPAVAELVVTHESPRELQADHVAAAEELTRRVAASLQAAGLGVDTVVRQGDPSRTIVDEAKDWEADLVVVGSRGHSALERWLIGSVAQSVVAHAPCSVEVVRRRG